MKRFDSFTLDIADSRYPKLLKLVNDPPKVLYAKGVLDDIDWEKSIAIVGTRSINKQGEYLTQEFAGVASRSGLVTISGMAFGVDGQVHRTAIKLGYPTVAVLASHVDQPTPYSHQHLYRQILEGGGLILSETPPGQKLHKGSFLRRNRIIAALSPGTLIIQAGKRSGAVSTATLAFGYGRSVYAVPGGTKDNNHAGCNRIIRELKASLVDDPIQVLADYFIELPRQPSPALIELSTEEEQVIKALSREAILVEQIAEVVDKTIPDSLSLLSSMEIKGCIELADDGRYHVKPN